MEKQKTLTCTLSTTMKPVQIHQDVYKRQLLNRTRMTLIVFALIVRLRDK